MGGRREGLLNCYKEAALVALSLHSLESSSEPGAIAKPARTAQRTERAQIELHRGQGRGRRVQAPILDLFPSSGAFLDPAAASWLL